MLGSTWRNFKFFESVALSDPPLVPPHVEIVSCCLSHAYLFAGDAGGQVHIIDRTAAAVSPTAATTTTFQAYTGPVTHMQYVRSRNLLVTLGDDDSLNTAILRLWQVDECVALCRGASRDSALWRPPSREHRLFSAKYPAPSAAAGAVLVKVNQNEDRLRSIRLRAAGGGNVNGNSTHRHSSPTASSPASPGPTDAEGIAATSLLTIVVTFTVSEDVQHAAIALTNGECVVLHGDLERDRGVRTRRLRSSLASGRMAFVGFPPKAYVRIAPAATGTARTSHPTLPSGTSPAVAAEEGGGLAVLYTVFDRMATVWAIHASGKYTEYPCHEAGRLGAVAAGCACMTPEGGLVVCNAGDGALSVLGPRPPPSPAEGKGGQTTAVAPPLAPTPVCFDPTGTATSNHTLAPPAVTTLPVGDDAGGGGRRCRLLWHAGYAVLLSESLTRPEQFHLQCYDTTHLIRGLGRQQERYTDVAHVLSDGAGELLVLSQSPGQTARLTYSAVALREVDILAKLDLLFSKECYGIAKRIAGSHAHGVDPALHRLIEKRYADYLYTKGRYAEAMEEYSACIGSVEPSYVIRRYMQSQHMELLTCYLERLHQRRRGYAVHVSHTTLLLNCYIRQRDGEKLLAFVRRDDVRFEAPNAIAVCRQGGYYEAALHIADKYAQVYERASILIHDLHQPQEALAYVRTLGVDDAEDILKKAGKQLLAWAPLRTTDAILQLCVRWAGPARRLPVELHTQRHRRPAHRADATEFLHVFVDAPVSLLNYLRGIVASGVLEPGFDAAAAGVAGSGTRETGGDKEEPSAADAEARQSIYHTLFELLIVEALPQSLRVLGDDEGTTEEPAEYAEGEVFPVEPLVHRREQALTFLEAYAGRYDDYAALSLSHQHGFEEGTLFLLRKLRLATELMHLYEEKLAAAETPTARRGVMAALLREMEAMDERQKQWQQAQLQRQPLSAWDGQSARAATWTALLTLLAQSPHTESEDVARVLDRIEADDLLSPTAVMEVLCASSSQLQLRAVRQYCERTMRRQLEKVRAAQEQTASRLQRVQELEREVVALQTTATVFPCAQCAHCAQPLDFPAVHFMCRHSFHQRCLNTATQCNLCAAEHQRRIERMKERLDSVRSSEGADAFFTRLQQSGATGRGDGFDVLTDYISRGVLGPGSATSAAMAPGARRPEALLFAADPGLRAGQDIVDDGQRVYDSNGDALDVDTVEWW